MGLRMGGGTKQKCVLLLVHMVFFSFHFVSEMKLRSVCRVGVGGNVFY